MEGCQSFEFYRQRVGDQNPHASTAQQSHTP